MLGPSGIFTKTLGLTGGVTNDHELLGRLGFRVQRPSNKGTWQGLCPNSIYVGTKVLSAYRLI